MTLTQNAAEESVAANKAYTKAMQTDTIKLKDTNIVKTISARGKIYDTIDSDTGDAFKFAGGTKIQNSKVFAGKVKFKIKRWEDED